MTTRIPAKGLSKEARMPEGRDFFVVMVYDDGLKTSSHWFTDDIERSREADEANPFMHRTWISWEECPNFFTCDHHKERA